MSYRFMRILVFYDLPTLTLENKKNYRVFNKYLRKKGFIQLQESVYCKLTLNQTAANNIISSVELNKPPEGSVILLIITERQFEKMTYLLGEKQKSFLDSDERNIIL